MNLRLQLKKGVTLVEVLTSIIVAVIGVAGVLILIPFGIRQAKVGLSLDNSTTVAENVLAEFEIMGYSQIATCPNAMGNSSKCLPWIDATVATPATLIDVSARAASCYWIDPLSSANFTPGAFDLGNTTDNYFDPLGGAAMTFINGDTMSTDVLTGTVTSYQPQFVQLLNLVDPFDATTGAPNPALTAVLRRLVLPSNELQFALATDQDGNPIDDLSPPQPFFDIDPARADGADNDGDGDTDELDELAIRRQVEPGITWSAVAVPRRNTGGVNAGVIEGFDFYILVYSERDFTARFPVAQVSQMENVPRDIVGTGTITVDAQIDIANDQWIMLVNFDGAPNAGQIENPQPQVGFYRVIGSDPDNRRITMDGPAFTLDVDGTRTNYNNVPQTTFAIALPDVVNVYRRQLNLEITSSFIQQ